MEGVEVDHLAPERSKAQFDVDEMKIVWAGSRHAFEVSDRISRLVASDPAFRKDDRTRLDRKALFKNTLRKAAYAWKRIIELRLTEEEASRLRFFVDQPAFTDLHWGMFVPAIKGQGTDEQQKKWLPLAYKMQIIGCYAQTELGHGSNVQGLETTATFDPQTDEFVIHSPTLTSSKWWPGGLGKVSTHAIVYARLITDGQDHGINGFIVQLRSLDDHLPLPGITIGDIGMKFGNGAYNSMDNGVLTFDHVRIPRDQMLMRVAQVTREGKYMQSNVPKQLLYGTMVYVRQTIVADASCALSRAVCIATRYSAVRRQFGSQNGGPETLVIDYKTQQNRLFPLLASAYAFRFVGEWLKWLYTDVTQRLQANDFSTLHGITKSVSNFLSLQSMLKQRPRLKLMFNSPEYSANTSYANKQQSLSCIAIFEDNDFWRAVEESVAISEPFLKVLREVSGGKPAVGSIYELMTRVKESIRTYYIMDENKSKTFLDIVDRKWRDQLHSPLHAAAAFLNPSIQYNPEIKFLGSIKGDFFKVLEQLLPTRDMRHDISSQMVTFTKAAGMFNCNLAREAIDTISPGLWWEQYGDSAPVLQRVAIRILSQVCSTFTFERHWNSFQQIHTEKRNKIDKETLNDLVYINYNLKLARQMRTKSLEADPILYDDIDMTSEWVEESESPSPTQWLDRFGSALDGSDLNTRQFSAAIFGANDHIFGL